MTPATPPSSQASGQPASAAATAVLSVVDLGRMRYQPAYQVQLEVHQGVLEGRAPPTLILVEHEPVITVSRRKAAAGHLLAPPEVLARMGIEVQPTDRGGDITYHGPGQLVAYPILRLAELRLSVGGYMRLLEDVSIDALAALGVRGIRHPANTGVWVEEGQDPGAKGQADTPRSRSPDAGDPPEPWLLTPGPWPSGPQAAYPSVAPRKICAMGIRVRRGVTLHGLALNIDPDMRHFATIVPCGLAGYGVTSLRQVLGPATPTMQQVKTALAAAFARALSGPATAIRPVSEPQQ